MSRFASRTVLGCWEQEPTDALVGYLEGAFAMGFVSGAGTTMAGLAKDQVSPESLRQAVVTVTDAAAGLSTKFVAVKERQVDGSWQVVVVCPELRALFTEAA